MNFELLIETEPNQAIARLRLIEEHGTQLAASIVELLKQSPAKWEGLLDTRHYVQCYTGSLREATNAQPKTEAEILDGSAMFVMGNSFESGLNRDCNDTRKTISAAFGAGRSVASEVRGLR